VLADETGYILFPDNKRYGELGMRRLALAIMLSSIMATAQSAKPDKDKDFIWFIVSADSFTAVGKWTSPNDATDKPFPAEVQIDCFDSSCIVATAEYYMGHPHVSIQYLQVLKWDKNGIVAVDSSPTCMTNTILINFADRSISLSASLKKMDSKLKSACAFFGAKNSQSFSFVLKNSDQWNKDWRKELFPDE
jgi:hypothetical protein